MFKQPIIIESDFFLKKMSIFFDVAGMMLFPFLIIKTYPEQKLEESPSNMLSFSKD